MYGAIIWDVVGSKYEFNNIKTKELPFISGGCSFIGDTVTKFVKILFREQSSCF